MSRVRFPVVPIVPVLLLASFLVPAALGDDAWCTNFESAQEKAKAEKKILLMAFTGYDWCPWCKKLNAEVFKEEDFLTAAHKQFILVNIDFPRSKKLVQTLQEQNNRLAKEYKVEHFPTVMLVNANGEFMARTGYAEGGPKKYLGQLDGLLRTYQEANKLRARLPTAKGLVRAKLLDQLIEINRELGSELAPYAAWRKEIVVLDAANTAGLKHKYQFAVYLDDAQKALAVSKPAVAEEIIDKALALPQLAPKQIQRAALVKGKCCLALTQYRAGLACMRKALNAAPKGENAQDLEKLIARTEKQLEKEEQPADKQQTAQGSSSKGT